MQIPLETSVNKPVVPTLLTRRAFALNASAMAAAAVCPLVWAQTPAERPKVVVAVGGKTAFYNLPLTLALQLGYFKDEGLSLDIQDYMGGSQAMQAVLDGSADIVSGAFEHVINLQIQGHHFVSFVQEGRIPAIALGISPRNLPNYRSLTDLRGKTMGVSAVGSSTHMVANFILSQAGLKPGDVNFVGVGTAANVLSAFRAGQLDALSNVDPALTMLEQRGEIRIVADTRTLKGAREVFGGGMPAGCLYAPNVYLQKYPHTTQAMANAMVRSLKWLQTAGPGDIIKVVPESFMLGDRALYLGAFNKIREAFSLDGVLAADAPRTALNVLSRIDSSVSGGKVDLSKTYTNEFANRARERYKV